MKDLGQLGFSEAQGDLMEVAKRFCRDQSPIQKVRALMEDDLGHDPDVWNEMAALGWLSIAIPEEYEGGGLGMAEIVPIMEQMGRYFLAGPFFSTSMAAQALLVGGTEVQKQNYLPKIAAGSVATLALSEQSGNWDLTAITARASHTDQGLALSGEKFFVRDAAAANWIIASVVLDDKAALVLISRDDLPEGALRREVIIDETKRAFALKLDGITVPKSALLDPAQAEATLAHIHLCANLLSTAEMCGGTQNVIDYTLDYLRTRKQFGRTIGSYQALKHPSVDAYTGYEKARSLLYSAAHSFNEQGTGEIATRMAKAQADTAYAYAADRSIQFHGGFGFTYECDAQLYRRSAIWHASQYGDAAYHRKKLAALLLPS
ncbi:MAG: acyl-CoA dehydrogenase [Robiginitomaculum sp.]|nr:MAG: acyl-CoA dehydrogenase [Robiginitomaculum sp.]